MNLEVKEIVSDGYKLLAETDFQGGRSLGIISLFL